MIALLVAYGPAKTEPESALTVVVAVVAILVAAGVFAAFLIRSRRRAPGESSGEERP